MARKEGKVIPILSVVVGGPTRTCYFRVVLLYSILCILQRVSRTSSHFLSCMSENRPFLTNPGHEIQNTEYRTEFTENRTESTETEIFGSLFGS